MAEIVPFRGVYYDPDRIGDIALVATPPYDVITPNERVRFEQRHTRNFVRLILPEGTPTGDRYRNASSLLGEWLREGILVRESSPSMYPYEQTFSLSTGRTDRRRGFMSLVKLEPLGHGSIIPHERTTPKPVEDRSRLLEACQAHLSQVFALYSDPRGVVQQSLQDIWGFPPRYQYSDDDGVEHKMWRVSDVDILRKLQEELRAKTLLIADGHHRYTTALNYQEMMRQRYPGVREDAPFDYMLMYLTSMEDKGLIILPTHRVVPRDDRVDVRRFVDHCERHFQVRSFVFDEYGGEGGARRAFFASLDACQEGLPSVGVHVRGENRYMQIAVKTPDDASSLMPEFPEIVRSLDVALLDEHLVKGILGIPEQQVFLTKDRDEAVDEVLQGDGLIAFILKPPTAQKVRRVAEAGEVMPRKSTYFYPKVASGLVIHKMFPEEVPGWT